jgi:hypothetical protein
MAGLKVDASPSKCPFCGQPLVDETAVAHLRRAQETFEAELRASIKADAKAELRERLAAAKKEAAEEAQERLLGVREQLASERKKVAELKKKRTGERAELEQELRTKLRGEYERREKSVTRTLEKTLEQKEELERKLEHLSAQERGDMNEVETVDRLQAAFPTDKIEKKGRGGDIFQTVLYGEGGVQRKAGLILYECKDTAKWSNDFLAQVKRDGQTHKTPYLVLVTRMLPRGEKALCVRDGVVVVQPQHVVYLAELVRRMTIDTHRAEYSGKGQRQKTAALLEYLSSQQFRDSFAQVVHAAETLNEMLQTEKDAHTRTWRRRELAYAELGRCTGEIDESLRMILAGQHKEHNGKVVAIR